MKQGGSEAKMAVGRWTAEEHKMFMDGLNKYGREWKRIADTIPTRTVVQIRTHAQKHFQKLAKAGTEVAQLYPRGGGLGPACVQPPSTPASAATPPTPPVTPRGTGSGTPAGVAAVTTSPSSPRTPVAPTGGRRGSDAGRKADDTKPNGGGHRRRQHQDGKPRTKKAPKRKSPKLSAARTPPPPPALHTPKPVPSSPVMGTAADAAQLDYSDVCAALSSVELVHGKAPAVSVARRVPPPPQDPACHHRLVLDHDDDSSDDEGAVATEPPVPPRIPLLFDSPTGVSDDMQLPNNLAMSPVFAYRLPSDVEPAPSSCGKRRRMSEVSLLDAASSEDDELAAEFSAYKSAADAAVAAAAARTAGLGVGKGKGVTAQLTLRAPAALSAATAAAGVMAGMPSPVLLPRSVLESSPWATATSKLRGDASRRLSGTDPLALQVAAAGYDTLSGSLSSDDDGLESASFAALQHAPTAPSVQPPPFDPDQFLALN